MATSLSGVFAEERCKVLAVLLDTNDVAAEAVWESSLKIASESSGRSRDSEIVRWCCERENIGMSQDAEGPRHVTVEGFEDGGQQRKYQGRA